MKNKLTLEQLVKLMPPGMSLYRTYTNDGSWTCSQYDGIGTRDYPTVATTPEGCLLEAITRYWTNET